MENYPIWYILFICVSSPVSGWILPLPKKVCVSYSSVSKTFWTAFDYIFSRGWKWAKEQSIRFVGWFRSPAGYRSFFRERILYDGEIVSYHWNIMIARHHKMQLSATKLLRSDTYGRTCNFSTEVCALFWHSKLFWNHQFDCRTIFHGIYKCCVMGHVQLEKKCLNWENKWNKFLFQPPERIEVEDVQTTAWCLIQLWQHTPEQKTYGRP